MKILFPFLCIFFFLAGSAQTPAVIEQRLLESFKKIDYWKKAFDSSQNPDDYDSIENANDQFKESLLLYTSAHRLTISYAFPLLKNEGLHIVNSEDGLLRIYSWDKLTGGTMHYFLNVYQYKSKNKVHSKVVTGDGEDEDPGWYYTAVHLLSTSANTYYLAEYSAIYSTKDMLDGIKVFRIKDDSLHDTIRLIKTKTGLRNSLSYYYDFFTVYKRPERPVELMSYNPVKKTITIPVVKEDGEVTNRSIRYIFTGRYFELSDK